MRTPYARALDRAPRDTRMHGLRPDAVMARGLLSRRPHEPDAHHRERRNRGRRVRPERAAGPRPGLSGRANDRARDWRGGAEQPARHLVDGVLLALSEIRPAFHRL